MRRDPPRRGRGNDGEAFGRRTQVGAGPGRQRLLDPAGELVEGQCPVGGAFLELVDDGVALGVRDAHMPVARLAEVRAHPVILSWTGWQRKTGPRHKVITWSSTRWWSTG